MMLYQVKVLLFRIRKTINDEVDSYVSVMDDSQKTIQFIE